jgi:hypothetical protein
VCKEVIELRRERLLGLHLGFDFGFGFGFVLALRAERLGKRFRGRGLGYRAVGPR